MRKLVDAMRVLLLLLLAHRLYDWILLLLLASPRGRTTVCQDHRVASCLAGFLLQLQLQLLLLLLLLLLRSDPVSLEARLACSRELVAQRFRVPEVEA